MPSPMTLQELETHFKADRENTQHSEHLAEQIQRSPRSKAQNDAQNDPAKHYYGTALDFRRARGPEDNLRLDERKHEQATSGANRIGYARQTSPPPPSSELNFLLQKQRNYDFQKLVKAMEKGEPIPIANLNRLGQRQWTSIGQDTTILEEDEGEGQLQLPAFSQAFDNVTTPARPEQSSAYVLKHPPELRLPGLGQTVRPDPTSYTTGAHEGGQNTTKFIPISKSSLFADQPPTPPHQLVDTLRAEFDTKLSLLEERLERKIGADAQSLSTSRDLERKLKESEVEKEVYKAKVAELEKKAAMMKGWRD